MKTSKAAFLWDESFLWGLMAYRALKELALSFDLIKAEDIKAGILADYKLLFVPGGWASNKSKALGEKGIKAIQDFVAAGGSYLGFCGGAGLATQARGGLGLLNIKRRPTKERVPSFSGRIELNVNPHPMWEGLSESGVRSQASGELNSSLITHNSKLIFHAWWPSQFVIEDDDVTVLAVYGDALPDAFSSDLNVGDAEAAGSWEALEDKYQINLNPARLKGELSVIEGRYGKGKVVLSLVHFDTPYDDNGRQVLVNLWQYLAGLGTEARGEGREARGRNAEPVSQELLALSADIITLGQRNFLWFWRNSMLLQWRRGVRGLEYNSLYIMMKEIAELTVKQDGKDNQPSGPALKHIRDHLIPFAEKSGRLLVLERFELQKGNHISYEKCDDPEIRDLRNELFSDSKSHGGSFKDLLDNIDKLLYALLTEGH
jgi:putative intracellular protease/amidase